MILHPAHNLTLHKEQSFMTHALCARLIVFGLDDLVQQTCSTTLLNDLFRLLNR
ncbi:hypothetical protein SynBIOSU31_01071 [Synechococcus sp. BIOS-U3-1]|nr:hypothetical protein SynBIOSU31_01071 [Synechococcus sp. BIOS-U3-1]